MRHNSGDKNVDDALELVAQGVLSILDDGTVIRNKRRAKGRYRQSNAWQPCAPSIVTRKVNGYLIFGWTAGDGKQRNVRLNRLVYAYLKGPLHPGYEVHHDDNDKTNNSPDNLVEITHLKNLQLAALDGLIPDHAGELNPCARVGEKEIMQACKLLTKGATCTQAARTLGISVDIIRNMAYGKTWQHLPSVQNLNYHKRPRRNPIRH